MQMSVIFADERCPGQKQWLILPGEKTQRARVKWDERVVQVDVPGYSLGGPPHCPLFFLKQIDYRRSAGKERSSLPAVAAALAMFWNIGSLIKISPIREPDAMLIFYRLWKDGIIRFE